MPLTKVTKSLITSVDVSQINTTASDAGKVLTSDGSTLSWTASASIAPSSTTTAKAWVNFNGTGSVGAQTINSSYNVTSVTKNSTGDYTINFAVGALSNANYCVVGMSMTYGTGNASGASAIGIVPSTAGGTTPATKTTSAVRINVGNSQNGAVVDSGNVNILVFGS